jgi:membrane-bound lytic murein transglycosylase F
LRPVLILTAVLTAGLLAGCGRSEPDRVALSLDAVREAGEIVVVTVESPTTYVLSDGAPVGYEVDLVDAMSEALEVSPRYVVAADLEDALAMVEQGRAHLAAAGVTITQPRLERMRFAPAYKAVTQQLACRRGGPTPDDPSELVGLDIAVVAGSSYEETLERLAARHPGVEWRVEAHASAMPLLEAVQEGRLECTLADSNLVAFARLRFPEIETPLDLTGEQTLAWALPTQAEALDDWLGGWFAEAHADGTLEALDERWYGHLRKFDYVDVARFIRRLEERLPPLQPHFIRAAEGAELDWSVLAAQAYQESHWDPDAVSPTGVRGVMMLTLPTARRVGVDDRTDPVQSINGGAIYLADLYDRLPESVTGEDRLYMALAAYNVGMGHLYDARRLAERLGYDKDSWTDMREVLPLLTQEEHYSTLRYGYARGYEPVRYVSKIRQYRALLEANL